jgi:hypothetical protein
VKLRWSWLCLLGCVACSRGQESPRDPEGSPPGRAVDSTSPSPDESAPMQWTASLDSADGATGEQPRVVVRCEAGRLGAYLVMAGSETSDSAGLDERAVPVAIDSAPLC